MIIIINWLNSLGKIPTIEDKLKLINIMNKVDK